MKLAPRARRACDKPRASGPDLPGVTTTPYGSVIRLVVLVLVIVFVFVVLAVAVVIVDRSSPR
jgi:hypothetical protein